MLGRKIEILLVEDNPHDVHQFITGVGEAANVAVARTGAEAVDYLFRRGHYRDLPYPDLVVIDLNIPLLNGHEVLNMIRSNSSTKHLPVVVHSVSDDPTDIRKAYDLGACAYMIKATGLEEAERRMAGFSSFWLNSVSYV